MASLAALAAGGLSFLAADTAPTRQVPYPSRQPRGSGNRRFNRWRRFYPQDAGLPLDVEDTTSMVIDDVNDFVEHFDAYLREGEIIESYTIEATDGLTIVSDSLSTPDISYRIQADGDSTGQDIDSTSRVKIVATTDLGRVETRLIYFELVAT
jgi:hypothetical protein